VTRSDSSGSADRVILLLKRRKLVFDPFKYRQIDRVNNDKRSRHAVHFLKIRQGDGRGHGANSRCYPKPIVVVSESVCWDEKKTTKLRQHACKCAIVKSLPSAAIFIYLVTG